MSELTALRIANALIQIKRQKPYLRVGQILLNAAGSGLEVFYMSDVELAERLEDALKGRESDE
jgi:hypothetical protein